MGGRRDGERRKGQQISTLDGHSMWLCKLFPGQRFSTPSADSRAHTQDWPLRPVTHCSRNIVGRSDHTHPPRLHILSGSSHHYYCCCCCRCYFETGSRVSFETPYVVVADLEPPVDSLASTFQALGLQACATLPCLAGVFSILSIGPSPASSASLSNTHKTSLILI